MKIVVLPMYAAEVFKCDVPWAAISITCYKKTFPTLSEENRVGLLQLDFDDVNVKREGSFTQDHAVKILEFAKEIIPQIETLLVHCHAGVSRSPAVAASLYKLLTNASDSHYFRTYVPNTLVYNTILETANNLGIIPGELC
jgi:predicted protein tyrosine phosphatase